MARIAAAFGRRAESDRRAGRARFDNAFQAVNGKVWFAQALGNGFGSFTVNGVLKLYNGSASGYPFDITTGSDGNLWYTDEGTNCMGRLTTAGAITSFCTGLAASPNLLDITSGPDGNVWFTDTNNNVIGRITTSGVISEFSTGLTSGAAVRSITSGPDGNLWFTESNEPIIGRITPSGTITEYSNGITTGSSPRNITTGPDGNLWFTEFSGGRVAKFVY